MDIRLRYKTATRAWEVKSFHYKTSETKLNYFVIMEVSRPRTVHKNILLAFSSVPELGHIVCTALYMFQKFQLDSTLSLCATTRIKNALIWSNTLTVNLFMKARPGLKGQLSITLTKHQGDWEGERTVRFAPKYHQSHTIFLWTDKPAGFSVSEVTFGSSRAAPDRAQKQDTRDSLRIFKIPKA